MVLLFHLSIRFHLLEFNRNKFEEFYFNVQNKLTEENLFAALTVNVEIDLLSSIISISLNYFLV